MRRTRTMGGPTRVADLAMHKEEWRKENIYKWMPQPPRHSVLGRLEARLHLQT